MKIEIDAKEFATLINMIREQREPVGNTQALAEEVVKGLPQKIVSQLNLRT